MHWVNELFSAFFLIIHMPDWTHSSNRSTMKMFIVRSTCKSINVCWNEWDIEEDAWEIRSCLIETKEFFWSLKSSHSHMLNISLLSTECLLIWSECTSVKYMQPSHNSSHRLSDNGIAADVLFDFAVGVYQS